MRASINVNDTPRLSQNPLVGCLRWMTVTFVLACFCSIPPAAAAAAGGGPQVVIVEFHGLKNGIIADNLDRLPTFRQLIKGASDKGSYIHLPRVLTTIPAASVPACTAMYTGRHPRHTGVVSTIWFDRTTREIRTMIDYFQDRINRLVAGRGIKTIFEHVARAGGTSLSAMLMMDRGADWSLKSGMFFWGNASTLGFLKNGRYFPDPWYIDHKTVSAFLTGHLFFHTHSINGRLQASGALPDLMVVQLLGTDIRSHFPEKSFRRADADMDTIQRHYAATVLDPEMKRMLDFFQKKGCYDQLIFILLSQQGFIKIRRHLSDSLVSEALAGRFRMSDASKVPEWAEAVVMPGACTKEVYLKNRRTGRWLDPPRLLTDIKPAVDALLDEPRITSALKAMVVRQYPGERHEGIDESGCWWRLDLESYPASQRTEDDFLTFLEPFEKKAADFALGDAIVRGLNQQYSRETTPDIKLVNQKGIYFERDTFKYGHHGSYYPEDLQVSFWIAGPGLQSVLPGRHVIEEQASTLDLIPMTAFLLGFPAPGGLDGRNPLAVLQD